jgi:hypothetical protein
MVLPACFVMNFTMLHYQNTNEFALAEKGCPDSRKMPPRIRCYRQSQQLYHFIMNSPEARLSAWLSAYSLWVTLTDQIVLLAERANHGFPLRLQM